VSRQASRSARLPAHPAGAPTRAQRQAKRALNEAIDRALLGSAAERQRVLELGGPEDAAPLADRVRLRAKRLAKSQAAHRSQILTGAESLVLAVYRHAIPRGWMCGFCDASVAAHNDGRVAGVGGIILDASGRTVVRISRRSADCEPFEAEIAALEATLDAATGLGEGARRIRVYTDCDALVALWLQRRADPRLRGVRALARRLRGFQLHRLPRRHNQAAHRLARNEVLR
jgi:hypothetical protein